VTMSETATNSSLAVESDLSALVSANASRRRFVGSAICGIAIVTIPYLWVLFVSWNSAPNLYRNVYQNGYGGDFYDLQARAMLSGHLYVPKGSLALETWTRGGHDYTYFGLFPSLLRIPIFLFTHQFDGKLTAISLLLAWLLTGLMASLLIWRVRIMLRGDASLGRAESLTLGVLVASIAGGSVLVYLAANPYVYSEDKAWSVALSLGAFFVLLGMLERPSWGRVCSGALFIVATNLTRATEGYACVIGALLVGTWFLVKRRRSPDRRWWVPMFGVAVFAVVVGSAVNWAKFGTLFGLPLHDYEAFHALNEKQINRGRYFDLAYLPSTLFAYLQPGGLRFTSLFPFVTLPAGPTRAIGDIVFDSRTRTASVTASMPVLFLLSCVGLVGILRRRATESMNMLRIVLFAAATTTGAVLFYGWIANRYLADFLPFLVLASAIGAITLWYRMEGRSKKARTVVSATVLVLGIFGVFANVALSITPTDSYAPLQASRFLQAQNTLSNLTGHPLAGQIERGNHLPYWAPADSVFIAGNCNALYVSNGENYKGVLDQRAEHRTWVVVEEGAGYSHSLTVKFDTASPASARGVPLLAFGRSKLLLHSAAEKGGYLSVWFTLEDQKFSSTSVRISIRTGSVHSISLETDRYTDVVTLSMDESTYVSGPITYSGVPPVHIESLGRSRSFSVTQNPTGASPTPLCRTLAAEH
jgi:hypothetical protein